MNICKSLMIGLVILAMTGDRLPEAIAQVGRPSRSGVTYVEHNKVDASFTKNSVLFESGKANYRVLTARREKPGEAEIHFVDTDIIYVVNGKATFVTGGTPVGAKTTAPDEQRAPSIRGGESHHLSKGDVIIVPAAVPHWFKEVNAPFLYFVVKVR